MNISDIIICKTTWNMNDENFVAIILKIKQIKTKSKYLRKYIFLQNICLESVLKVT